MSSKFFFFTDPALLDAQAEADAFGPQASGTSFRTTDLHSASANVPAFSACSGSICAQADDHGTLTLILKPDRQAPFDFPVVSYFIYKGIDPTSLFAGGTATADSLIAVSKADVNPLIDAIKTSWTANANPGDPTGVSLGLHLKPDLPTSLYPSLTPADYAPDAPLGNLFFKADGDHPAIHVGGGARIGEFKGGGGGAKFGLVIALERLGYEHPIALARQWNDSLIPAHAAPATGASPDDLDYFLHWHDKEACLGFVDPSAFWGSFLSANLRVWNGTKFESKSGGDVYNAVLRGGHDDAAQGGNFWNRNRAYLDIRNEHGQSFNYYREYQDGPLLSLDPDQPIAGVLPADYYGAGWPVFTIATLPAGTTGDKVKLRLALPKGETGRPLLYVAAGHRGSFRRLRGRDRFFDRPRPQSASHLEEIDLALPLVTVSGTARLSCSYQKIHCFKTAVPGGAAGSLWPAHTTQFEAVMPLDVVRYQSPLPGKVAIRTYADEFYVPYGGSDDFGFAARPGIASDGTNLYFLLICSAQYSRRGRGGRGAKPSPFPALSVVDADSFLQGVLPPVIQDRLEFESVFLPENSNSDTPTVKMRVVYPAPQSWFAQFWRHAAEHVFFIELDTASADALKANLNAGNPIAGSSLISLVFEHPNDSNIKRADERYARAMLHVSRLVPNATKVVRDDLVTTQKVYARASVD